MRQRERDPVARDEMEERSSSLASTVKTRNERGKPPPLDELAVLPWLD